MLADLQSHVDDIVNSTPRRPAGGPGRAGGPAGRIAGRPSGGRTAIRPRLADEPVVQGRAARRSPPLRICLRADLGLPSRDGGSMVELPLRR